MINITQEEIMQNWGDANVPLVSIKCLVYNHENYVSQALDGFLMQKTNFPFEVIIHDDASTDGSAKIIKEYEEKYPRIIKPIYESENQYSKHDGSLGRAIDPFLKGKYIALCEGDDYWIDENKLQMQVDFLERNLEYAMVFHNARIVNEMNEINPDQLYNGLVDKDFSPTELFKGWLVPTAAIVMKKECLNYPYKDENQFLYGDIKIVESCAHMGKVYCINKYMSIYRIQSSGLTWDKSRNYQRFLRLPNHFKAIKKNFPLIKKSMVNDKIVESYLLCALKCGNILNKIGWCFSALFVSPAALLRNIKYYKDRKSNEKI